MSACATINVKVVPGASRSRVVGRYGDAVKVQIAAPPEAGKANRALVELLAGVLGVARGQIEIVSGHNRPRKVVRVLGMEQSAAEAAMGMGA